MPLLLLDLDNTLVDRQAAYAAWAADYLAERGLGEELLSQMIAADADGVGPKAVTVAALTRALDLDDEESSRILGVFRAGIIDRLQLVPGAANALADARSAGWTCHILTNGNTAQQRAKIRVTGLANLVDGWTISDEVGLAKPDPAIYRLAAERAGVPLDGAWMIGDAALTDIAGAQSAGIDSVYLSRGRGWPPDLTPPTATADSLPEAIGIACG